MSGAVQRLGTAAVEVLQPPPTRLGTVLVIDDNAIDLILYRRVMTRTDLFGKILTFDYAEDALAHMASHPDEPIDAILLDIHMPRMCGQVFLEQGSACAGNFCGAGVIVMLTSLPHPELRARLSAFPVVRGYVDKPLTAANLVDVVALARAVPPSVRRTA